MKNKNKNRKNKKEIFFNIFIALASVVVVAGLSSLFTKTDSAWYVSLNFPSQFVPGIVFPIVWTTVYALFAVTIFLLLSHNMMDSGAIILLTLNGLLQILWCLVFFTLNNLLGGLIVILTLLALSVVLIFYLYGKKKIYALLLAIYPIWIMIATSLNLALWILN